MEKVCTKCGVSKTLDLFQRRSDTADGYTHWCKVCKKEYDAQFRVENRDKLLQYDRSRDKLPHRRKQASDSYKKHASKRIAEMALYAKEKPEIVKRAKKAWKQRNPSAVMANTRHRQASKLQATPSWNIQFFVEEAYDLARRREKATGFKWEVDHVIPLIHPLVCGLHVHTNLQVIPARDNRVKNNSFSII